MTLASIYYPITPKCEHKVFNFCHISSTTVRYNVSGGYSCFAVVVVEISMIVSLDVVTLPHKHSHTHTCTHTQTNI